MKRNIKVIEDKKTFLIAIISLGIIYLFLSNYWHYPSPPIETITSKEVINLLDKSDSGFVKISTEGEYDWYVGKTESALSKHVFRPLSEAGWEYQDARYYYDSKGRLESYDRIYVKPQSGTQPSMTLELNIHIWTSEIDFLKIRKGIKF
ncbi:hypothetical protein [Solibacillus ferritrahens]|uniref:hypothetical protein n=1 Tax=Solibacillus ferritrahens TaxID=3098620 RepID=UPI00300BD05D